MERRKLTKEDIDKVRDIEGFPIGTDDDIIALSDAPYYTACPNPFIEEFIKENGTPYDEATDDYHREPFAADVSEGKTDPIYMAHAYHTKVPYKAIMRYILHYTNPGDIVFDGFCGTGMTGIAAAMCGIDDENRYILKNEMPESKWGKRNAIIGDLSPAATFISNGYNSPVDKQKFFENLENAIANFKNVYGWMYQTKHNIASYNRTLFDAENPMGTINYTIWSDVFVCPHCGEELVFADLAIDFKAGKVKDTFICPKCKSNLKKTDCKRALEIKFDDDLKDTVTQSKQVPVLINYTYNGKRYEKKPDQYDIEVIEKINKMKIPYWYPTERMIEGGESRRNDRYGITHVHHFFTRRNLAVLAYFNDQFFDPHSKFLFTSIIQRASKLFKWSKNQAGPLSGTLYISSCVYETSILSLISNKEKIFNGWKISEKSTVINTASTSDLQNISENTIDYIFTDPPFGSNLNYSELSFIWEAWLRVETNNRAEAIMNDAQGKGIFEYQSLMESCFKEYYRVLKPNRWMTVEFHNSQNAVWNSIQEALLKAGFIIADIRTLDKKQGSFKQVNTTTAVKQDLVISCYKPQNRFLHDFQVKAGSEETAWSFVRQHLSNLPIAVVKNGKIEIISERQSFLLWDRMVAYHIMQGVAIPLDAVDFYKGLDEKFLKRDGMYFLPNQVNEYDIARATAEVENIQFALFVSDEKSAIGWLYQQLDENGNGPQTYQDLQPKFMQETKAIDKREKMPELSVLLEENFLKDDKGRWYIPDLTKSGDIAKLREKNLLKEFQEYMNSKGKLKLFRSEAIRVGFSHLWKDKNYQAIVDLAERLPEQTIQEDPNLLMYYDISLSRI